jgi:amino acid transporter
LAVISQGRGKSLGVFQLVMINVIAVDSIRTLPFAASYGFSVVFFYLLAARFFFIPTALVSAELGTGWPNTGGIYVWVREAFGKKWSLIAIWLNWMYNIVWYPTIVALIAATAAYLWDPNLAANRYYMAGSVLFIFWSATLLHFGGMRLSSLLSTLGAIIGTIFPMLLVSMMGIFFWKSGKSLQIDFTLQSFFPSGSGNLAFLTNILFGLMGLEMAATHAAEMKNPKKDYPRSVLIAAIIILSTIVFASLAISVVVPASDLQLATGVMQAFSLFLDSFNLKWALPIVAALIILGALSGMGAWIIGPSKGIMVASEDGSLPTFLKKKNRHGVPTAVLLTQAIIVSILCLCFVFLPSVNSSFWVLSAITAQLAILVYILLFAAAIRLHHTKADVARSFKVPGKKIGMWLVAGLGIITCVFVVCLGFIPPSTIGTKDIFIYVFSLLLGMLLLCLLPLLLLKWKNLFCDK